MSDDSQIDLEYQRKRLVFRANHRGIKEADIVLGGFVVAHVHDMDHDDIRWFERLFEEYDQDILNWIFRSADVPDAFATPMMARLQKLDYVTPPGKA